MTDLQKVIHYKNLVRYRDLQAHNAKNSECEEERQMYEAATKRTQKHIDELRYTAERLEAKLQSKLHHAGIPKLKIDYAFTTE